MMAETMPILFCIDREIIESSALLIGKQGNWNILYESLDLLDLKPRKIVVMKPGTYFAWTLHITTPWVICKFFPSALRPMQHYVLQKYKENLSRILPHRRVFVQKKKNSHRYVVNHEELMKGLSIFSNPSFEMVFSHGALYDQIVFFRSIICLLASMGGGGTNTMWMVPSTVFIEIQSRHCDPSYSQIAYVCGLQVFELTHPFINMYDVNFLNVKTVVKIVQEVFVLLKWN
jgi:hypothetical protein